jgi:acyl dehydratase
MTEFSSAPDTDEVPLDVGYELEPRTQAISSDDLLEYTIASRDPNLIHHDPEFARASGLPGTIVQGTLKAGLLARFVTDRLGDRWQLDEFAVQYRGIDLAGASLTAHARIIQVEPGGDRIQVEAWLESMSGDANTRGRASLSKIR